MKADDKELKSEATAIKLLGMALEKIEKELLWEMGGQAGGADKSVVEVITYPGEWMMAVRGTLVFDMQKLNRYFYPNE
ncbi:MAG: hypothetical protein LBP74_10760 [Treponema sp.]|jgi:hypothetical protein|nr:hypothetical protein [Treponema sp.]